MSFLFIGFSPVVDLPKIRSSNQTQDGYAWNAKNGAETPLFHGQSKPDSEVVDHTEREALPVTLVGAFCV
ncbi:hypothetical protein, partial [Candidatus Thiosymbion oneisti]|uniref:hypothetical protein n=1 Tax=Candidatus Thiosymbion oneisti TaxID=589554 RepID=UPI001C40666D